MAELAYGFIYKMVEDVTGKDGINYPGGGLDWLGFDDGRRALPSAIPEEKVVPRSIPMILDIIYLPPS